MTTCFGLDVHHQVLKQLKRIIDKMLYKPVHSITVFAHSLVETHYWQISIKYVLILYLNSSNVL
jgi:hypothetical protein